MDFFLEDLNAILPPELTEQRKGRLSEGLKQFSKDNLSQERYYTDFYSTFSYPYFLQGDLIRQLRFPVFDFEIKEYKKKYYDAILLSNTCDVDVNNVRNIPKKAVLAKVIPLDYFVSALSELDIKNATSILTQVKNQMYSNLLYLPKTKDGVDYIAYFDEISIIGVDELNSLKDDMKDNRIATLDFFGYYLFIFKLSFNFCRLPEETQR